LKFDFTRPIIFVCIVMAVFIIVFPLVWIVLNSFKYFRDIITLNIFNSNWTITNYETVLISREENIIHQLLNSIFYVITTLLLVIPLSLLAGYGLARSHHSSMFKILAINLLVFSRIIPSVSIAVPYFVIFKLINIYDTPLALVIVYSLKVLPLSIFMIMTFIEEVPIEVEEAASIDGASLFLTLRKIVIPLILPGLAATAIFSFINTWNDYIFAAFLAGKNSANLQIAIAQFNAEYFVRWGELCAALIIGIAPVLIFTIIAQKYLVRGLTLGAIKG